MENKTILYKLSQEEERLWEKKEAVKAEIEKLKREYDAVNAAWFEVRQIINKLMEEKKQ